MAKEFQLGVRWEATEREALERAAIADQRAPSTLVRIIVVEWLKAKGWLRIEASPDPAHRKGDFSAQ